MRRKILLFGAQFLPLFAVFLWVYPHALPLYQRAVVGLADVAVHRLDPPMRMELTEDGGWRYFRIAPDGTESFYFYRPGKNLNLTLLSLALLPALLLATPVGFRRRLWMLGLGLLLLLVLHVLAALGLVVSIRCLVSTPDSAVCKWLKTVINTHGQLMSVVIWGLLSWDVWLPSRAPAQPEPRRE